MWACEEREPDIVSILLKKGADVNIMSNTIGTALMWATFRERTEIVILIENHIRRDKISKETNITSLIVKKGLTQKGDKPLVPYAHREMIRHIASFF